MADQPARALIVYGDGFMRHVAARHSHIHALAAAGTCGFLALRSQPSSGNEAERVVGELAQILDIHDIYPAQGEDAVSSDSIIADGQFPSMSERFMGIKAGMFSNSRPAAALGKQAGFSILNLEEGNLVYNSNVLSKPSVAASHLLVLLGLQDADTNSQQYNFDLLLLHLATGQEEENKKEQSSSQLVDWVDELLGALQEFTQPGTKAGNHLYLIVVLGYGSVKSCYSGLSADEVPLLSSDDGAMPELAYLVPRQSYTMKGGHSVDGIREHHPLLVAYHLNAVTRRDETRTFSYEEFQKRSGNLTILVDRFLHEVAFKLWKAPKYGA